MKYIICLFSLILSFQTLFGEPLLEIHYLKDCLEVSYTHQHPQIEGLNLKTLAQRNPFIQNPKDQISKNERWAHKINQTDRELVRNTWSALKADPLVLFMECVDLECPLTRRRNPSPRHQFEQQVIKTALNKKGEELHIAFFGSGYLFDSLVQVSQILQQKPGLKTLKIDLVDTLYAEYIQDLRQGNDAALEFIKYNNPEKENWFNFITLRFTLFSALLQHMAPQTKISLRISTHLHQEGGSPDLIVASDLFDGFGGLFAFQAFLVNGATVTNEGGTLLMLARSEESHKKYQIKCFSKLTSAEHSLETILALPREADWYKKASKQIETVIPQFKEE